MTETILETKAAEPHLSPQNHSGADEFVTVIPCRELAGSDTALGVVENDAYSPAGGKMIKNPALQWLAVTDTKRETFAAAGRYGTVGTYPMDVLFEYRKFAAPKPGMTVALAHVDYVALYIGAYNEQRFGLAPHAETFSLADGVEMCPIMFPYFS